MHADTQGIALVTGASRGLGFAMAEALAGRFHILAVARTVGALEELDDRIKARGGSATLAPVDLTEPGAVAHICRSIFDRWGRLDLLVHAAIHAAPLSPTGHIDAKDWARSVAVNATLTHELIAGTDPLLRQSERGTAVFFDDARAGQKFFGAYGATKAAQMALARSWQAEGARTGPRVLVETPPPMPTATRARFFPGEDRGTLTSPATVAAGIAARL
ncbi:MAG: SDR family oxidoreductase [Alphaproteobacteria bacterium]|nr:MAG: SDR family oxidoreductase [Alphaproteobacteria bacterium]